jgi:DNA-damage-inducible protein D
VSAVALSGSSFDALRRVDERGEYWSARELVTPLGYTWRRFADAIERGRIALEANGQVPDDHIRSWTTPSKIERGNGGPRSDYRMTREGVYATIQGADPRKPEIAAAWSYFRIKTREAETGALAPTTPRTYLEALEAAVGAERQRIALAAEVAELAPKAAERDAFVGSADDRYSLNEVAKSLGTGRTRLTNRLIELNILFRDQQMGGLKPYQKYVDRTPRLFDCRYEPWPNGQGYAWVPYVTPAGISFIHRKLSAVSA